VQAETGCGRIGRSRGLLRNSRLMHSPQSTGRGTGKIGRAATAAVGAPLTSRRGERGQA
jgi:hypothetical protein